MAAQIAAAWQPPDYPDLPPAHRYMARAGYLVLADITGYTAFLSGSELEHAQDSLSSLLNLLLERTRPPLVISNLEGDAVFAYAPEGSFLQGQTLVEAVEQTYVTFRQAIGQMVLNTTCTCDACRNIPNLDLKFFVHSGEFATQQLGDRTELVGTDVTLVHRLAKNSITEKTGFRAYAAYTGSAIDDLGVGEMRDRMAPHAESYEHLGEVKMHVQDMQAVWERERDRVRTTVHSDDAVATVEYEFPVSQALVWDYATKPEHRALLTGSEGSRVEGRTGGRIGDGTTYYCAHGESVFLHTIVDWQPPVEYTIRGTGILGATYLMTTRLSPTATGTLATALLGRGEGPLLGRLAGNLYARFQAPKAMVKGCALLEERIKGDVAAGMISAEADVAKSAPEEVERAAAEVP